MVRSLTLAPPPRLRAYEFTQGNHRFVVFEWDAQAATAPEPRVSLTDAERAVHLLLLAGKSTREIASARGSSERTVANQIAAVFRKFGVHSRGELAAVRAKVAAPDD